MAEKIKILILAANPGGASSRLRLDQEVRGIIRGLRGGRNRESFEVFSEWAVRPSDLQEVLLRYAPHIVHFTGQRSKNKGITLESRDGEMATVSGRVLARLFRIHKDHVRILFFNGYLSRKQIGDIRQAIDFTIVTNAIGDEAGAAFASYFYQALAFGQSVTTAFELALVQLDFEGIDESKTPQLLVREGVDRSNAYLIEATGLVESGAVRSIKRPAKQGNITIADAARAVYLVANDRKT